MNQLFDTIAAVATPAGAGGIGMVRISGERAHEIADAVFRARSGDRLCDVAGYTARLGTVVDSNGLIDEAVALIYRAPHSYTGENVAELMCHGGEIVTARLLKAVLDSGAVMAGRGEFSRRAFLNGRITLTEAEAVCDVINAASRQGETAAAMLAKGALRQKADCLGERMLSLQAHITAYIDFPEEDVDEIDFDKLRLQLREIRDELSRLLSRYETGSVLLRGVQAVIAGSPNVGKSTLLNLLAGAPRAIVTPIAGTTRDIVEERVRLGGTVLLLADTAGIRSSDDLVEHLGIERAIERLESASLVFAVFDSSREFDSDDRELVRRLTGKTVIAVVNKTDLPSKLDFNEIENTFENVVYISAKDESSLDFLDRAVARALKLESFDENEPILANERQRSCAARAHNAASAAVEASETSTLDVVYALLGEALEAISELSGGNVSEEVLDEVFSRFCVGK